MISPTPPVQPDLAWYTGISTKKGLASPRCPYAQAARCPRYFESLSLLGRAGSTEIDPAEDKKLQAMWEASDLWPLTAEQSTSVSGPSDGRKSFIKFCPEVAFLRFGLFASELLPYSDVEDGERMAEKLSHAGSSMANDYRWHWWHVKETHYSDCDLYSLLPYSPQAKPTEKPVVHNQDKHYQIFISSTYKDLAKERQSVTTAVMELGHMPAGMELFPAANESAWKLITQVIDSSDYYILIIGGRYGSLDENGIGFTEKEYDYAVANKKPVIAFLHKDPEGLPRRLTETDDLASNKLSAFRGKVENGHTCRYWNTAEELKSEVLTSLTHAFRNNPAVGWIRANRIQEQRISHNASFDVERDRRQRAFLGFLRSWRERFSRTSEHQILQLWQLYVDTVIEFRSEQGKVTRACHELLGKREWSMSEVKASQW